MPLDGARVQLSTDGGATFTDLTGNCLGGGGAGIWDKELIAVDNTGGPNDGNVYLVATDFSDVQVKFVRSTDGGLTWSLPVILNPGHGGCDTGLAMAPRHWNRPPTSVARCWASSVWKTQTQHRRTWPILTLN